MKKKITAILLAVMTFIGCTSVSIAENTDTGIGTWYYQYAKDLPDIKILLDNEIEVITPQSEITQEEFIYLAVNILGDNIQSMSMEETITFARENQYIFDDEMSEENKLLTRQMAAIIISRILKLEISENTNTSEISDYITDWEMTCPKCKPYILSCYANGIMSGYPDGSFGGRYNATLAEIMAVLSRAWGLIHEI